jgi:hydroxylaminobenzene mutase
MDHERRLLRHGFALFLLALLTGLVAYGLANPRMGVAAHVEGILNAIFLMVLGLCWPRLGLKDRLATWIYWTGVVGAYANWLIPLFSAMVGASQPKLAGAGFRPGHGRRCCSSSLR